MHPRAPAALRWRGCRSPGHAAIARRTRELDTRRSLETPGRRTGYPHSVFMYRFSIRQ